MNIVYLIKFKVDSLPNLYIGSKTNCTVVDGKIIDKRGKVYMGSSTDTACKDLIKSGVETELLILGTFDTYEETIQAERTAHIANDVVADPKFFNKSLAMESNYADPSYATYKHIVTGKKARLPRNHPLVLSGEWVGITKGTILTPEQRLTKANYGEKNGFYGKKHSQETLNFISENNSKKLKGKVKTDEHKRKLSEAATKRWEAYRERKAAEQKESI